MDARFKAIVALAGLWLGWNDAFAAPLPKPIATNKTRFRIPFKFDAAALQRMNARELQLHVSNDRGLTWALAQTLAPDGGKFEYEAASDGEYWFAVKTVDGRNQIHPPVGKYETGLIVAVDTAPPLIDLSLQQTSPGRVQLSWQAADANLDIDSIKLELYQPGGQEWETIEVAGRSSGTKSWNVNQSGQFNVRGAISDTAGNVGRAEAKVAVTVGGDPAPVQKTNRRVPIAELNEQDQAITAVPGLPGTTNPLTLQPPTYGSPNGIGTTSPEGSPNTNGFQIPRTSPESFANSKPPTFRLPLESTPTAEDYRGPVITPFGGSTASSQSSQFVSSSMANRPDVTQNRWSSEPDTLGPNTAQANRTQQRLRVVNTARFQVGYKIEDVGPSGVGGVEMFITQDHGRKWWKYGDDPDKRSPFDVEVPRDGEYGFAIRVRSGAGLSADPPAEGEPPAIVVAVDQTAPNIEMLPVQQGQGANVNRIQIRWRLQDEHPSEKPVSLYYAASRIGPWEPISAWREDNGSFEWTVGPGVPSQLFLRIVARDSAGNTSKAETPTPIVVDLTRPTARIVDVESPQGLNPQ